MLMYNQKFILPNVPIDPVGPRLFTFSCVSYHPGMFLHDTTYSGGISVELSLFSVSHHTQNRSGEYLTCKHSRCKDIAGMYCTDHNVQIN